MPPTRLRIAGRPLVLEAAPSVPAAGLFSKALCAALPVTPATRLVDVGCGSGVVGLVALRAGAAHVLFNDLQRAAVEAVRANLALNGLGGRADVWLGPFQSIPPEAVREATLLAFNPPQFPTALGERFPAVEATFRDGGPDGLAVVGPFLDWLAGLEAAPPAVVVLSSLLGEGRARDEVAQRGLRAEELRREAAPVRPALRPVVEALSEAERRRRGLRREDGAWTKRLSVLRVTRG